MAQATLTIPGRPILIRGERGVVSSEAAGDEVRVIDVSEDDKESRRKEYLTRMKELWPEDELPIVDAVEIEGRVGFVGITSDNNLIVSGFQVKILHAYEKAMGCKPTHAARVGGFFRIKNEIA